MQLQDNDFSVICFRQGTVSGYSPRMRFDLIVNAMFKSAVSENIITVNNPSIWRPILAIQDAATAYVRAVQAEESISGVFNIASENCTVGEVADYVKDGINNYLKIDSQIDIKQIQDFRNYKVSTKKAENILSYKPQFTVNRIIKELVEHYDMINDFDNPNYYNIRTFKELQD